MMAMNATMVGFFDDPIEAQEAVGGLLGAMLGLWLSEREARLYAVKFASGRAIVAVPADMRAEQAVDILRLHHRHDIHREPCDPIHPERAMWRRLFKGP